MSPASFLPVPSRRTILLLVAGAAAVLLALALLVEPPDTSQEPGVTRSQTGSEERIDGGSTAKVQPATSDALLAGPEPATDTAEGAGRAPVDSEDAAVGSITPVDTLDAPSLDAKIIRTATIQLRLERGGFEDAWSDAQAVAGTHGGYIVSASRSGADDGPRLGTLTMRVPTDRFDAAVERLRELDRDIEVERLDVASQDVTQEYVDVRSRLRHDRAVEARLLALLARTEGVSEVLAVQARLDQVQEQIEVSRGRLQYLEKLTAMSTIQVTLREPRTSATDEQRSESTLGEALRDARERFEGNVAAAIVWLGGALPAVLLLAVIALAARLAWRRRATDERRAQT